MSAREYLIDASAYWRIDRGAVLAAAWRDHLERGLAWICPPTEMEICRRVSKDQHTVHLREFTDTYVQVELHHRAGAVAREIPWPDADLVLRRGPRVVRERQVGQPLERPARDRGAVAAVEARANTGGGPEPAPGDNHRPGVAGWCWPRSGYVWA